MIILSLFYKGLPKKIECCVYIIHGVFLGSFPDYTIFICKFKGALSGLKQFLATESPFKMMKNAFYFTLRALFVLKIFKFLS